MPAKRTTPGARAATRARQATPHREAAAKREAMPEHLPPMLATPGRLPRQDDEWAFEVKWDGIRAISHWRPGEMRIESRNLKDISARYPELRALSEQLKTHEAVLDGEIVAFDELGRPSF
jgi:bifunctional non-homologous end joining protein LigD